jgi:hypothetical protein
MNNGNPEELLLHHLWTTPGLVEDTRDTFLSQVSETHEEKRWCIRRRPPEHIIGDAMMLEPGTDPRLTPRR